MVSIVTRSQLVTAPVRCGRTGESNHGCANLYQLCVSVYHVNVDPNLWGIFPAPYLLYTEEDIGSFESYRANPGVPNEVAIECKHHSWIVYCVYDGEMTCKKWCPLCELVKFCKCFSASFLISLCCFKVSKVFMKSKCHWKNLSFY